MKLNAFGDSLVVSKIKSKLPSVMIPFSLGGFSASSSLPAFLFSSLPFSLPASLPPSLPPLLPCSLPPSFPSLSPLLFLKFAFYA